MLHKTGSVLYLLWGLLHVKAALSTYQLGALLEPGLVQGRVYQDAWNLLFIAISVSVIAVLLNWKNSRLGFWLNLAIAAISDIGFTVHVLIPGHFPLFPGVVGPILWIIAMTLSAIAIQKTQNSTNY